MWKSLPYMPALRVVAANDSLRPGSAGSSRSGGSNRPRAQKPKRAPRGPPVSFRRPSTLSLAQSVSSSRDPSQLAQPTSSDAGSIRTTRDRADSVRSSLSKRRSTDLLDAVEEFRPLDFRSRVQAAGARDYGEDVADRNILLTTMSTPDLYSQYSSARLASVHSDQRLGRLRIDSLTRSMDTLGDQVESTATETVTKMPPLDGFNDPASFSRKNKMRLSLNTYKPSGLVPPSPRSAGSTPGHRGGMTPRDFEHSMASSPHFESQQWSRQYHKSPSGSNFSIPRSPMTIRHPVPQVEELQPEPIEEAEDLVTEQGFGDIAEYSSQRRSGASSTHVANTAAARFSHGTYRSSMASSISSRYPSMDFLPLGYPRLQGHHHITEFEETIENDDVPTLVERSQSLRK